jgi:hypothetical protein
LRKNSERHLVATARTRINPFSSNRPAPASGGKKKRTVPLWLTGVVAAVSLFAGTGIGAGGDAVTDSPEYIALQTENASLVDDETGVVAQQDALAERIADVEEREAVLQEAADAAAAEQAAAAAAAAAEKAAADQAAAVQAEAERVAAEKAAADQAAAAAQAAQPVAAAPQAASAYYENCTAARNAGAAPVRTGDAGYGRHLDRDGDGIGCE